MTINKDIQGKIILYNANKEEIAYIEAWHKIREYIKKTYGNRLYAPLTLTIRDTLYYTLSLTMECDGEAYVTFRKGVVVCNVDGGTYGRVTSTYGPDVCISERFEYEPVASVVDKWESINDELCAKVKHKESIYNFEI